MEFLVLVWDPSISEKLRGRGGGGSLYEPEEIRNCAGEVGILGLNVWIIVHVRAWDSAANRGFPPPVGFACTRLSARVARSRVMRLRYARVMRAFLLPR